MRAYVAAGWHIHHITDRVVELQKDDPIYRKLIGRSGYVRVRGEPGMDRAQLLDRAMNLARKEDETMAFRVAHDVMPTAAQFKAYQNKIAKLEKKFGTPEDPEVIGVKRA